VRAVSWKVWQKFLRHTVQDQIKSLHIKLQFVISDNYQVTLTPRKKNIRIINANVWSVARQFSHGHLMVHTTGQWRSDETPHRTSCAVRCGVWSDPSVTYCCRSDHTAVAVLKITFWSKTFKFKNFGAKQLIYDLLINLTMTEVNNLLKKLRG